MQSDHAGRAQPGRSRAIRWLLIIPFVAVLWVPFYNGTSPRLFGFPLFYWYQLLWIPLTSIITWIVYRAEG